MHGRLPSVDDFYLKGLYGKRYELINVNLTVPDVEAKLTTAHDAIKAGKTTLDRAYSRLEKYHELQFESSPAFHHAVILSNFTAIVICAIIVL